MSTHIGLQVFLAVSKPELTVIACIVVESISSSSIVSESGQSKWAEGAWCGVRRMWARDCWRRKGVVTRLLDSIRDNFIFGYRFERRQVAFSQPTTLGRLFAEKYLGSSTIPVYDAGRA